MSGGLLKVLGYSIKAYNLKCACLCAVLLRLMPSLAHSACVDTNPPAISCPQNIVAYTSPGQCSKIVTFSVTATNRCDPAPVISCNPTSGSVFSVGKTIVNCSARDASGNTATCAFTVTVFPSEVAPGIQWQQSFGGTLDDYLVSVQQTSDGGYVLGGTSYSDSGGNKTSAAYGAGDYWLVRLDPNGNKLWDQTYGGSGNDILFSLQQTGDGGFILAGASNSGADGTKTSSNYGGYDYWLVRVNSSGGVLWDQSFGGLDDDGTSGVFVRQTTNGGFIVGGDSRSGATGSKATDSYGGADFWLLLLDANGNEVWERSFGGSGDDLLHAVQQTSDGGYLLGGSSASSPSGNKTSAAYGGLDFWIVRLDSSGNKIWEQSYGGSSSDQLYSLQLSADGGMFAGGASSSIASGNKTSANFGSSDYWVLKLNSSGNKIWEQTLGGSGYEELRNLQATADGGCVAGGFSPSVPGASKSSTNFGGNDYWVARLDNNGARLWDLSFGGSGLDNLYSVKSTSDGGYILGGYSSSLAGGNKTSTNYGGNDFWVVKLAGPLPAINCPTGFVAEATSPSGAVVSFTISATNTCQPNVPVTCTPPSGSVFALGTNLVSCSAVDAFGVSNQCLFTVVVRDTTAPGLICPPNITTNVDSGQCFASKVVLGTPITSDAGGSVTTSNNAPSQFSFGVTPVVWTATDPSGNTSVCTQTVTVAGPAPSISCPTDMTLIAPAGQCSMPVTFSVPVSDVCDSNPVVTCNPPSGSNFPVGRTTVTCTARDAAGSTSICNFVVSVFPVTPPPGIQWQQTFGGAGEDSLQVLRQTTDNGYILGGHSSSTFGGNKTATNYGNYDFWVVRLDPLGNKVWEQSYGGSSYDSLTSLQLVPQGGFVVAGTSASMPSGNKTSPNYGGDDFWVVRLDASGAKLWENSFGGNDNDWLYSVQNTSDGGFIVGGWSISAPSGNKTSANFGSADYWVVRLDANGNKLWDQSFGGSGNDSLYSIIQTADGGFLLGGTSSSPPSGNKTSANYGNSDFWVVRLDANGTKLWDQSYGGSGYDALFSVQPTTDGGFVLAGYSASGADGTKTSPGFGDNDYWIVRIDSAGNQLWDKTFGGVGTDGYPTNPRVRQSRDGGFLLAGQSASAPGGNKTAPNYGGYDYWVTHLDASGNLLWDQSFGGSGYDALAAFEETKDGGLVLGGISFSGLDGVKTTPSYGSGDFWVLKLAGPTSLMAPTGIVAQATSAAGAVVTFTATATNLCQTNVPVIFQPPSGSTFPMGTTVVVATAVDAVGFTNTASFAVTVIGTNSFAIIAPAAVLTNTSPGQCFAATVILGTPVVVGGSGTVTVTNDAPTQFGLGITLVTWTAHDGTGSVSTATQSVTVQDKEPPVILTCASNRSLALGTNCTLNVPDLTHQLVVSDNCNGPLTVTQNPTPASLLSLGTNLITFLVLDGASNAASCQAQIVLTANPPVANPDSLSTTINAGLTLLARDLLTNDVDPDQRSLLGGMALPTSSTNGGQVRFDGTNIVFTPPTNYVGLDAFSYTNQDCSGLRSVGQVLITINPVPHPFSVRLLSVQTNASVRVSALLLSGAPGYTYRLQRTQQPARSNTLWLDVALVTTSQDPTNSGLARFFDTNPPSPAFYRTKQP